jgi:hypothetical protein
MNAAFYSRTVEAAQDVGCPIHAQSHRAWLTASSPVGRHPRRWVEFSWKQYAEEKPRHPRDDSTTLLGQSGLVHFPISDSPVDGSIAGSSGHPHILQRGSSPFAMSLPSESWCRLGVPLLWRMLPLAATGPQPLIGATATRTAPSCRGSGRS